MYKNFVKTEYIFNNNFLYFLNRVSYRTVDSKICIYCMIDFHSILGRQYIVHHSPKGFSLRIFKKKFVYFYLDDNLKIGEKFVRKGIILCGFSIQSTYSRSSQAPRPREQQARNEADPPHQVGGTPRAKIKEKEREK